MNDIWLNVHLSCYSDYCYVFKCFARSKLLRSLADCRNYIHIITHLYCGILLFTWFHIGTSSQLPSRQTIAQDCLVFIPEFHLFLFPWNYVTVACLSMELMTLSSQQHTPNRSSTAFCRIVKLKFLLAIDKACKALICFHRGFSYSRKFFQPFLIITDELITCRLLIKYLSIIIGRGISCSGNAAGTFVLHFIA